MTDYILLLIAVFNSESTVNLIRLILMQLLLFWYPTSILGIPIIEIINYMLVNQQIMNQIQSA